MTGKHTSLRLWPPQTDRKPTIRGAIRAFLARIALGATTLIAAPGLLALIGARAAVARLLGREVRHDDWTETLGGRLYVDPHPHGWRAAALGLVPALLLAVVGCGLLWPTAVDLQVLGISPTPLATSDPALLTDDRANSAVAEVLLTSSFGDLLRIWTGAACWFCVAPELAVLRTVRRELTSADRARPAAVLLRLVLVPVIALRAMAAVVDEAALWFGLNVFIGAGGLSILCMLLVESAAVRLAY